MQTKAKAIASLLINGVIFAVTTGIFISYFFVKSELIQNGWDSLKFFTTDANLLAAIAAALTAVCQVQVLRGKRQSPPRAVTYLKLAGVVSLLLTFVTVMVLLVPAYGAERELGGKSFHLHVAAPLLAFLSFVWLDGHKAVPVSKAWVGLVPMVLYGAVYFIQVLVLKNWVDFYLFNSGGLWYVIVPVILAVTFGMSALVCLLQSRAARRGKK